MSTPAMTLDARARHLRGALMILTAGALWSVHGPLLRLIDSATEWQVLLWRALGMLPSLLLVIAVRQRGDVIGAFRRAGWTAVAAGPLLGVAFVCFVFSITHTTIANTMFMLATQPFLAAAIAWLMLGERVSRGTWIAMVVAATGIFIMVYDGLARGNLFGNLMGMMNALGFAAFSVVLRRGRLLDMMPGVVWAGLFCIAASAAVMAGSGIPFAISLHDLLVCLLIGGVCMAGGLVLFTLGSRYVTAAELTLLGMTEIVLGALWGWLVLAEPTSRLTLAGGALLLAAIVGLAAVGARRAGAETI